MCIGTASRERSKQARRPSVDFVIVGEDADELVEGDRPPPVYRRQNSHACYLEPGALAIDLTKELCPKVRRIASTIGFGQGCTASVLCRY
jgi:hypothetical protein